MIPALAATAPIAPPPRSVGLRADGAAPALTASDEALTRHWDESTPLRAIGAATGLSPSQVQRRVRKLGLKLRANPAPRMMATDTTHDEAIGQLWRDGKSIAEIARATGISEDRVQRVARRLGLPKRKAIGALRHGVPWSHEREAELHRLRGEGKPLHLIAAAMGVSQSYVSARIAKTAIPLAARPAKSRHRLEASRSIPVSAEETAQIERFLAERGPTRSVSFGEHQPAIDAMRGYGWEVFRAKKIQQGRAWTVNGSQPIATAEMYKRLNLERTRRGLAPIRLPR